MNHVFSRRPTSELPAGAEALLEMKARGKQLLESGAPEDPAGSLVPLIPQGERPVTGYLLDYLQLQPSRLRLTPACVFISVSESRTLFYGILVFISSHVK